jgi:hypothetical protein
VFPARPRWHRLSLPEDIRAATHEVASLSPSGTSWPTPSTSSPRRRNDAGRSTTLVRPHLDQDRRRTGDSPVRTEIAEAGSHLAQGLFRLVELVDGRRVYMTSGPWLDQLDPYDGWHGSLGWDISKDQTSSPAASEKPGSEAISRNCLPMSPVGCSTSTRTRRWSTSPARRRHDPGRMAGAGLVTPSRPL